MLWALEWKIIEDDHQKNNNVNASGYVEFQDKYQIPGLKYGYMYSIRVRAKLSDYVWTNYSQDKYIDFRYKWHFDSVILTDPKEIIMFEDLLQPKLKAILLKDEFSLTLLYRNSRDGNSSTAFHEKCNGYSNTITLIHSNYDHIFGGFTTLDWSGNKQWKKDDDAFLFLIRSQFNHKPRIYKNKERDGNAVYVDQSHGQRWGRGHDLSLHSYGAYSHLGSTYEGTGNELCGGETYKTYKDYHEFQIKEYEVFLVN